MSGIDMTTADRKEVDQTIRVMMARPDSPCPEVWREIKAWLNRDEAAFVSELRKRWSDRKD